MSRDENFRDRFARLREAHREHAARGQRDLEQARRDIEETNRAREEARRLHDEAHRLRDAERARRSGRRPLDAAAIAAAAVAIADAQGIDEVSMRKIAAVLGSGTMSLYHHVRTKEDLLAAMDDLIMGEILVAPIELKGGWRKAMTAIAKATRDAYRRHPWALTIQSEGGQPGLNGLHHVEQSLAALKSTGLDFESKMAINVVIDDFVFGHSLRAIAVDFENGDAEKMVGHIADFMSANVNPAEFPTLMEAMGDTPLEEFVLRMARTFHPDEWFETGLAAVLDGLARHYKIPD